MDIYVKLDGEKYKMPDVTFGSMLELAERGIDIMRLREDMNGKPLLAYRKIFAWIADTDEQTAGRIIEQHMINGGDFSSIYNGFIKALQVSGFSKQENDKSGKEQAAEETAAKARTYDNITDWINEVWIPAAVEMGISIDEFYNLNPKLFERYRPFFTERFRQAKRDKDEDGWLSGQYVARAIAACFSGKSNSYPRKPSIYKTGKSFNTVPEDDIEEVAEQEESTPMSDAERFAAWAISFNKAKFGINPLSGKAEKPE